MSTILPSTPSLLSRARILLLALPLFALATSAQIACGGQGSDGSGTNESNVTGSGYYGSYGHYGYGHGGSYGYP